ncbi:MAG: glycine--tRNA ligase subunit beta [Thermodesulfovibrionales bacterium]|nr:glycine--tRNA ligase subunit beta [Thermodesulfovibrionales bacterium]
MNTQNRPQLLLEIGTEEIPARFISFGINRLKEQAEKLFTDYRFDYSDIKTFGTPRRLALLVSISEFQIASEKELWGPPVSVAYDADGNLTKAGESFLKNNSLTADKLEQKQKGKGVYLYAKITEQPQRITDLLANVLKDIILSIHFPKSMRWGMGTIRFVRPIQWVLAIYDNKKVTFELENIKSNNMTKGHRFLSPASFEIRDTKTYINLLRNNFVILDTDERKRMITNSSLKIAESIDAIFIQDDELIEHVCNLVEYPQAVLCGFDERYLNLPPELLIIVMKDHQKYFALKKADGNLTNSFIVISNTKSDNSNTVRKGAEKVIKARFEDARFYFEEDLKTPPHERLDTLKRVVFHEDLGSLFDKTQRIKEIASYIANLVSPPLLQDILVASTLCKTDLVSGVVREFPELQGIMGGYYAKHAGYSDEIASAIKEHYLPKNINDTIPSTHTGCILSIADKIDNIVSFFSIGEIPSGTEDPFALRRQCYGIVSMLFEQRYDFNILDILQQALNNNTNQETLQNILDFFRQRVEFYLQNKGYEYDIIDAVIPYFDRFPLHTIIRRADALVSFKSEEFYIDLSLALKRVNNIAPKDNLDYIVDEKLLTQDAEITLFQGYKDISEKIDTSVKELDFSSSIALLNSLKTPINNFFDTVLVMDKDEKIRHNRLSLVNAIKEMCLKVADFSKLK